MGTFSKEWMYLNCNAKHHCLGVKLIKPVVFRGQLVTHLFVTEVSDKEFLKDLSYRPRGVPEDFNGTLQVQAFAQDPSDSQLIVLNMNNIETISTIK